MIARSLPGGVEVRFTEAADGVPFARPVRFATQVHGTAVATDEAPLAEADALLTTARDVAVGVRIADCVPIAIASSAGVAMVHAGWRGLSAGVIEAALDALPGEPLGATIGPCAGPCCYEVGDDVRAAFAIDTRTADLPALATARLRARGVPEIDVLGLCTIHDDRFFSYRRQGQAAGRNAGVAWRS